MEKGSSTHLTYELASELARVFEQAGLTSAAQTFREEAARRKVDAPLPPAPDDLVRGLRDRARHARAERNAIATRDAWHFEQAADAIEALRADAKRLREALEDARGIIFSLASGRGSEYEGTPDSAVAFIDEALAQGGNDG